MYPKRDLSPIPLAGVSHSAALAALKLSEIPVYLRFPCSGIKILCHQTKQNISKENLGS